MFLYELHNQAFATEFQNDFIPVFKHWRDYDDAKIRLRTDIKDWLRSVPHSLIMTASTTTWPDEEPFTFERVHRAWVEFDNAGDLMLFKLRFHGNAPRV